jgi:hypothetical protein
MTDILVQSKSKVDSLLSDEDQAILIQIRDNIRNNYFAIGDIANKYVVLCNKNKTVVLAQDIYDSVGKLVGKSGRTVRYYAEQAAFYPLDTRDKYDILPFGFFVFARSMGDNWESILDYCMIYPNKSLGAIRQKFLYEPDHEAIAGAVEDGDIQDIVDVVDKPQSEKTIGLYLSIMIDLSSRALSMAQNMPIPQDAKDKLQSAATQIREVLYSITPEEQL